MQLGIGGRLNIKVPEPLLNATEIISRSVRWEPRAGTYQAHQRNWSSMGSGGHGRRGGCQPSLPAPPGRSEGPHCSSTGKLEAGLPGLCVVGGWKAGSICGRSGASFSSGLVIGPENRLETQIPCEPQRAPLSLDIQQSYVSRQVMIR